MVKCRSALLQFLTHYSPLHCQDSRESCQTSTHYIWKIDWVTLSVSNLDIAGNVWPPGEYDTKPSSGWQFTGTSHAFHPPLWTLKLSSHISYLTLPQRAFPHIPETSWERIEQWLKWVLKSTTMLFSIWATLSCILLFYVYFVRIENLNFTSQLIPLFLVWDWLRQCLTWRWTVNFTPVQTKYFWLIYRPHAPPTHSGSFRCHHSCSLA